MGSPEFCSSSSSSSSWDATLWARQMESYSSRIQALGNPKLESLDRFYTHALPRVLDGRRPAPFVTKDELVKIMEWKLARGKWRPRLLGFVSALGDEEVVALSRKAFLAVPDLKAAVTSLCALKGVGPATASAVLAAFAPEVAPFMSDEALIAVFGSVKDYSLKQYLLFADKLQQKSKEIERTEQSGVQLTPSQLERALWSAAIERKLSDGLPGKKRKNTKGIHSSLDSPSGKSNDTVASEDKKLKKKSS